jgi:MraZ protein
MFIGQYDHSIDDKSRITLPVRFRDALAAGVVLSKGLDRSVDVYPKDAWQMTIAERIGRLDPLAPETRTLQRLFFGGAAEDTPDKQGGVLVPTHLLRYGSLTKDVTVVGNNDHLEIWDRAAWAERLEGIEGSADHVAERLAAQQV